MTSHRGKRPSGPSVTASIQTGEMAGNLAAMPVSASQDQDARTSSDSQTSASASPAEDFRVRCTLKRAVSEVMEQCSRFVQELGATLPEDVRELALRDAQWVGTGPRSFPALTPHSPALIRPHAGLPRPECCPYWAGTCQGRQLDASAARVLPVRWTYRASERVCNLKRPALLVHPYILIWTALYV